jgi:regulatory protein
MGDNTHIITGLETQKRNVKRVNVFVNDEFAFSLSLDEAAKLHKGQALSDADIAQLRGDDEVAGAVDRAVRLLGYRPRSEQEVRRSLAQKDFAEFWVSNRRQFKPLSARALRYELRQKGIAAGIIDEVLQEQDEDEDAYHAAQAQLRRVRSTDRAELRQKLMMFLARRGFAPRLSRDAVTRLLDELEADGLLSDEPAEDTLEDFDS